MKLASARFLAIVFAASVTFGPAGHLSSGHFVAPAAAATKEKSVPAKPTIDHGHVFLLRGLMNIWSRGMDELGDKLTADGVNLSVSNHRHWKQLADEAAKQYASEKNYAPIIIIGHSLGADAAVLMAARLGEKNVPVRLIICFDGVSAKQSDVDIPVSSNVQEVVNFYKGSGWGREMNPGKGFTGKIDNVDLRSSSDIGHMNIDKNPELQARVQALVMEVLTGKKTEAATN
jgi:Thioesterase domain